MQTHTQYKHARTHTLTHKHGHSHARMHARTYACTHTRPHALRHAHRRARTHTRMHARTHAQHAHWYTKIRRVIEHVPTIKRYRKTTYLSSSNKYLYHYTAWKHLDTHTDTKKSNRPKYHTHTYSHTSSKRTSTNAYADIEINETFRRKTTQMHTCR